MKYSQEYAKIIEDSGFPLEWRESAIEYKHLKKLIKKVSNELTSLGLNPVVLNRLLHPPTNAPSSDPSSSSAAAGTLPSTLTSLHIHPSESPAESSSSSSSHQPPHSSSPSGTDLELEFEFSSDSSDQGGENEDDYTVEQVSEEEANGKGKKVAAAGGTWMDENGKRFRVRVRGDSLPPEEGEGTEEEEKQRVAEEGRKRRHEHERVAVRGGFKAEYDLVGTATNPIPRLRLLPLLDQQGILQPQPRRASATSIPAHGSSRSSSHSPPMSRSSSPSSPSILRAGSPPTSLPLSPPPLIPLLTSKPTSPPPSSTSPPPLLSPPSTDNNSNDATSDASSDGASARDDEDEPTTSPLMASTPRYFFSSVKSPIWALQAGAEEGLEGLTHSPPGLRMPSATLSEEPESVADDDEEEEEEEEDVVVPPGFTSVIGTSKALGIPIVAIQPATPEGLLKYGGAGKEIGEGEALMLDGMGPPGVLEEGMEEISMSSSPPQHELYIDLASDLEFFNVLTHALTTLDTLQRTQQDLFRRTVTHLCATISSAAIPPPPRTTKQKLGSKFKPSNSGGDGHSDLYAWREVFTLWIEAEIFESGAERDRGERGIEEAERRLKAFAGEVTRRGLGDRRTLKSRESRAALNTFLQLNLTLLDLKKFQTANIQAARKILKKHDKRTALTASSGFPQFVISSLSAPSGQDPNNIKTWTLFDASLPHVLLACLTETLLPIIPSLDDYSCAICTSIAFKPIRLDCGHLFCVRCLAKMQRRGKTECPLCRAPVLASADGRNLDMAAMRFMKDYFPREVKIKQKENEKEVAKEDAEDMGMGDGSCTIA